MDVDGYRDPYFAALYDVENPWGACDEYYLHLAMGATSVLDVGCGTGVVLDAAQRAGHAGRLVGIDPADAMIARAEARNGDVEWAETSLPDAGFVSEFELVLMTGHAFQCLLTDDDVRTFLASVHRALGPGGRFAFETRNPHHAAWEKWHGSTSTLTDPDGRAVTVTYDVLSVEDELVTFTETYASEHWDDPRVCRSTLRFLPAERLDALLVHTGFAIDERYGDWDRSLFTARSREILTVARAV